MLTLLPVLGFLLASMRGYVRGTQVGWRDFLILTGIVIAAAGTGAALDMLLIHHFWRSALAEGMVPLVHVDTLNHWHWALHAALPTALALGIREVRTASQEFQE